MSERQIPFDFNTIVDVDNGSVDGGIESSESNQIVPLHVEVVRIDGYVSDLIALIGEPTRTEQLRAKLEAPHAEAIRHMKIVKGTKVPDERRDPEGYKKWMESDEYGPWKISKDFTGNLDKRTRKIVSRLITPINDRINQRIADRKEWVEEGFIPPFDHPRNRRQTLAVVAFYDDQTGRGQEGMLDIIYDCRDGGDAYTAQGEPIALASNPEMQAAYAAEMAELRERENEVRAEQAPYVNMLSQADKREWIRNNGIRSSFGLVDEDVSTVEDDLATVARLTDLDIVGNEE